MTRHPNFLRETISVNGRTLPAAVDTDSREIILLAADLPDDIGDHGEIALGGKTYRCRPWRTARGTDYLVVTLGKDLPPGLVE